jgi:hypothetical protein
MKMGFKKHTHFPDIPFKVNVSHCHVYPTEQRLETSPWQPAVTLDAGPPDRHAELQNLSSAEDVSMRKGVLLARKKWKKAIGQDACLSHIMHISTYYAAE